MNIYADDGDDCATGQGQIQIGRAGWQPTHFAQVLFFNLSPLCVSIKSKPNTKSNIKTDPLCTGFQYWFNFSLLCVSIKSKSTQPKIKSKPTHFAQGFIFVKLFSTACFKMVFFSQTQIKTNQIKPK